MKKKQRKPIFHQLPLIGTVRIIQRRGARNLSLSVREQEVRVTCPRWVSQRSALAFVRDKTDWVEQQRFLQEKKRQQLLSSGIDYDAIDCSVARTQLTTRLSELAGRHGFSYTRVVIRNQRSRWGSCSSNGTISLNCRLAALPEKLRDYVLLHELLHTRIPNHSAIFWSELEKLVSDARELSRELHRY